MSNRTSALLPQDQHAQSIQVLSPVGDGTRTINATTTSSRVQLPSDTKLIRVAASEAVYVALGDSTVDAGASQTDSMYFPAGVEFFHLADDDFDYVAAVTISGSAVVTITKMQ